MADSKSINPKSQRQNQKKDSWFNPLTYLRTIWNVISPAAYQKEETVASNIKSIGLIVFVALALRSFLFEPYNIPSESMVPGLLVGDFLFVSKWSYGYSKYAFPFAPNIFSGRILDFKGPQQGDVIVFKCPYDTSTQWIKRVVGLPGDKVQMKEGVVYINDQPATLKKTDDFLYTDEEGRTEKVAQFIETFPNGSHHKIIKHYPFGKANYDDTPVYEVPKDHYFVMGDNRDHSGDSRIMHQLGFVHKDYLLGAAQLIYFSTERPFFPSDWPFITNWFSTHYLWWQPWKWFSYLRYNRFLKIIH